MSAKSFRRLNDYANSNIQCTCQQCRHVGIVSTVNVCAWFRLHRWNDSLDMAGHKFKCSKCGARWPRLRPMTTDVPVSFPNWANHDRQKALMRRLRG